MQFQRRPAPTKSFLGCKQGRGGIWRHKIGLPYVGWKILEIWGVEPGEGRV